MIYFELFLCFLQVGSLSIGGGYAAIPIIQSIAVERYGWLTLSQFTDLVTIAEMTPGPIAINASTFVGLHIGGILGAIVATLSCILPSLVIVSVISFLYNRYRKLSLMQSVLSGLRPITVALIASAGLSILTQVTFSAHTIDYIGIVLFASAFFVLRRFKLSPILVMLMCGIASLVLGIVT